LLARQFGFKGFELPIYPNIGGLELEKLTYIRNSAKIPSRRNLIMLKGYQGLTGRALVGLRALARCRDLSGKYTIVIYSNTDALDIRTAAELFSKEYKIKVVLLPINTDNNEILKYHSMARISIGLSISDSISISVLEAMAMGSFPIQSYTSAADEWIIDGETGMLVPPEDPDIIELAIRKALLDDELVDKAEKINWETVKSKLNYNDLKKKTIESYQIVYDYSKRFEEIK
jgi:glycosyltransferase involved in cell wall biosynthesis